MQDQASRLRFPFVKWPLVTRLLRLSYASWPAKCRCRQQQSSRLPGQGQKAEMPVETGGCSIFGVDHDAGHRQQGAGVCHFLTSIGQKNRPQTFSMKVGGDRKSPDERHRHRISGQFPRQGCRQFRATYAAGAEGKKAGQLVRGVFRRCNKHPCHISPDILRGKAADVFVKRWLTASKGSRIDDFVECPDTVQTHRETCSACRSIAFFNAGLGSAGVSRAAMNA